MDIIKKSDFLKRRIDKLFDLIFKDFYFDDVSIFKSSFPAIDVEETEDSFIIRAEVPGMKKEDIKVIIDEDGITISGKKEKRVNEKSKTHYISEISYGEFQKYISFPREVQPDKAKAKYNNGILEIEIPKLKKSNIKEIKIE